MRSVKRVFEDRGFTTIKVVMFLLLSCLFLAKLSLAQSMLKLPPLPLPENYGSELMSRQGGQHNMRPVEFSHLTHRVKYTCRVCHYELEFSMKRNDTPIQCNRGKMNGRYCAACHNGKIAFGPEENGQENCANCHGISSTAPWKKLAELQQKLPRSTFGNGIDWSKALDEGLIKPKTSLSGSTMQIVNIKTFVIDTQMSGISSAVFPHKTHEQWLDCSSCHPELFNIKKKSTQTLRMHNMLEGESCGVCHLFVSFPLDDCRKCHPKMKRTGVPR
jgi:c(7)-type cytochrome triheme protein